MTLAVIRVRGLIGIERKIKDTMNMLHLKKKHNCVILPENNPVYLGMVIKIKDYVTFGAVSDETLKLLLSKCLKRKDKKKVSAELVEKTLKILKEGRLLKDVEEIIPVLSLNPPKKGFEKEGIKKTYVQGGALGKRDNMDDLIKRMAA